MTRSWTIRLATSAAWLGIVGIAPAAAQESSQSAPAGGAETSTPNMTEASGPGRAEDEIVVTARHRAESLTSAPVIVTAIGGQELVRRNLTRLDKLEAVVPSLVFGETAASIQGGVIFMRGIGSGEQNPFGDNSVSFNVDGVQVSRMTIRRLAQMDVAQIEVLKGPQALFFGKNSPGGVIIIGSKDPGDSLEYGGSLGYEFVGRQPQATVYLSTPITDTLGVRVAGLAETMGGYMHNDATARPGFGPSYRRQPKERNFAGRITLKFDPSNSFDAKLKLVAGHNVSPSGSASTVQLIACPLGGGKTQYGGTDDCHANSHLKSLDFGPAFAAKYGGPFLEHPDPVLKQNQGLVSLVMNYRPATDITITSATGGYKSNTLHLGNLMPTDVPTGVFASYNNLRFREATQELRLASSFSSPLNFMVGVFGQRSKAAYDSLAAANGVNPVTFYTLSFTRQKGRAVSAFAQLLWKIVPTIELSGGGRYSYEKKHYRAFNELAPEQPSSNPEEHWSNFSPEGTLTWRPSSDLTVFGSYKSGFLSGGFNGAIPIGNLQADRAYGPTNVKGFEGGVKFRALDGRLRGGVSAFTYSITGLQVSAIQSLNGFPLVVTVNAGEARTKGIEADLNFRVTDQLRLHGAAGYTHARYVDFQSGCWVGETPSQGCNQLQNPTTGAYRAQQLRGTQMIRSPDWSLLGGATWTQPLGASKFLELSADANYTSSYFTESQADPKGIQPGYTKLDASLTYRNEAAGYAVTLSGANLTNEYTVERSGAVSFTGGNTGLPTGFPADLQGSVNRGREVWLRVTFDLRGH